MSTPQSADKKRKQTTLTHLTSHSLQSGITSVSKKPKRQPTPTCCHIESSFDSADAMKPSSNGRSGLTSTLPSAGRKSVGDDSGKKKLTIKPFKVKPAPPAAFEETTLAQLSAAVDSVYTATSSSLSQEELYRAVESLCLHNKQSDLYSRLCQQCELHIATALGTLATDTSLALPDLPYLTHVASIWEGQCTRLLTLRSVFLYLDRSYVLHLPNVHSLWEMGLQIVRKHFLQQQQQLDPNTSATPTNQSAVESKTRQALLTLIEKERQGETVPRSLLRTLLRMYASLHLYSTLFEPALLAATSTFYTTESAQLLSSFSLSDYLHHVTTRVQQEHDRLSSYLDPSSTSSLISLVESRLIAAHTTAMIQVGFAQLCSESKEAELAVMYGLFSAVGALDELKTAFANYVKERGTTIVSNEEKEAVMVTELLALKAQLDRLLVGSFASSASFHDAVRMSFLSFLNSRENKPAEMIARHLDQLLRSGGTKGKTADEVESDIVATLWLFRHIQSKDVFQAFYKKDLARRLLLGRSASVDAEKSVIDKLRAECGSSFTGKLEGMFKDMELSKDIQTAFAQHLRTMANAPAVEISVSVLTTGSWPAYGEVEMRLPDEVRRVQDEFKLFYVNSHSGRKLAWQDSLSTAILRAHFPRGKKELQVNGMQAIVLMCFNPSERKTGERKVKDEGKEEAVASTLSLSSSSTSTTAASPTSPYPILTFTQLLDMTKLPAPELKRTLQSLCFADSVRLLTKEPKNRTLSDSDTFRIDHTFRSSLFRIKVPSLQLKETKEENRAVTGKVFEDRQYAIDAAIVRIMKARKRMGHGELMSEVISVFAGKFPVKMVDIKKRIGTLIDREYMERDKDNSQIYNYQA